MTEIVTHDDVLKKNDSNTKSFVFRLVRSSLDKKEQEGRDRWHTEFEEFMKSDCSKQLVEKFNEHKQDYLQYRNPLLLTTIDVKVPSCINLYPVGETRKRQFVEHLGSYVFKQKPILQVGQTKIEEPTVVYHM